MKIITYEKLHNIINKINYPLNLINNNVFILKENLDNKQYEKLKNYHSSLFNDLIDFKIYNGLYNFVNKNKNNLEIINKKQQLGYMLTTKDKIKSVPIFDLTLTENNNKINEHKFEIKIYENVIEKLKENEELNKRNYNQYKNDLKCLNEYLEWLKKQKINNSAEWVILSEKYVRLVNYVTPKNYNIKDFEPFVDEKIESEKELKRFRQYFNYMFFEYCGLNFEKDFVLEKDGTKTFVKNYDIDKRRTSLNIKIL